MKRLFIALAFFAFLLLSPVLASEEVFSDVASDHPFYPAIQYLHGKGVIQGYSDNTFRPDKEVNRAEALKIILLGSGILIPEIQDQEIFPDVAGDTWYAKYAAKGKNLKIVSGDSDTGFFRPGDTVNLAEALKILLKTNNKLPKTPSANPFLDVPKEAWFAPYFSYAQKAGLLDLPAESRVNPSSAVTRGLLAELMYRLSRSTYVEADGKASYYGAQFHGKTTASGEIFDASALTAAHRTYPFGAWLKITNVVNGKSVTVRVNDRGPYVSDETRILDLSQAAFEKIASISNGVIEVKIEPAEAPAEVTPSAPVPPKTEPKTTEKEAPPAPDEDSDLNPVKSNCPELAGLEFISKNTFEGIDLDASVPNRFLADEILTLKGEVSAGKEKVTAFIIDSKDVQTAFTAPVEGGRFTAHVRFPKTGAFQLGVIPGESGQSVIKEIKVLKNTCVEEVEGSHLSPVSGVALDLDQGDTVIRWNPQGHNVFKLRFNQGGLHKTYIVYDLNEWKPVYRDFSAFIAGDAELSVRGASVDKNSILESAQLVWSKAVKINFLASAHQEYQVNPREAELLSLTKSAIVKDTIRAVFKPKVPVRSKAALILPSGKTEEIPLTSAALVPAKNAFDIEVFPSSGESLTASFKTQTTGIHFLEVNNAEGLAIINVPIYIRNQFPLLPNPRDLSDMSPVNLGNDLTALRLKMLELINKDRASMGMAALKADSPLNQLAQYRSDDMVKNNYFGHWDKQGREANDFRMNYGIQTLVAENLARDSTLELAEYGLMRSAIHRSNILSPDWTRAGVGITLEPDGSYAFVQIFSTDPLNMSDLGALRNNVLSAINSVRASALAADDRLHPIAQTWSEKMAAEGFFAFTDKTGGSLVDLIHQGGITAALGTYIVGNSSFADALEQIKGNAQLKESKWKKLGVGIKQDNMGIIDITLIYTE